MSPRRIQLLDLLDFSGGLNTVADAFQLRANESPSLSNVDVDPIGGFSNREGNIGYSPSSPQAAIEGTEGARRFIAASTQYVQIADDDVFTFNAGAGGRSISIWAKLDAVGTAMTIVSKVLPPSNFEWEIHIDTGGVPSFSLYDVGGGTSSTATFGGVALVVGVWTHLCVTYAANAVSLYTNGVQTGTFTNTQTLTNTTTLVRVSSRAGGTRHWGGMLDDFAFFPSQLTPTQVLSLYTAKSAYHDSEATSYQATVLALSPNIYLGLGDPTGTNANDLSPNNRDGTYVATPAYISAGPAGNLLVWNNLGSTSQLLITERETGFLFRSTGAGWTLVPTTAGTRSWLADNTYTAQFKSNVTATTTSLLYIQDGNGLPYQYDGATQTVMADPSTTSWQDDYAAPDTDFPGTMPAAKFIASHMQRMWVAHTTENGVIYPNRVRFSHAGNAGSWRSADFFDIDLGAGGDYITGIRAFGEVLLVFKQHAVYAISGYDHNSFAVSALSSDVGAVNQKAIASLETEVYFYDARLGLHKLERNSAPQWLFRRILPVVQQQANNQGIATTTVTRVRKRIYVSIPWNGSDTYPSKTFVLDPSLRTKQNTSGSFVEYDIGVRRVVNHLDSYRATLSDTNWVMTLEADDAQQDTFGNAVSDQRRFTSQYTTSWVDVGQPAIVKKWRRPQFIMDVNLSTVVMPLTVDVWLDYNPDDVRRTFSVSPSGTALGTGIWDSFDWDEVLWSGTGFAQTIERGSQLGRGVSVQLRVTGPIDGTAWSLNAITLKYVLRRVRA